MLEFQETREYYLVLEISPPAVRSLKPELKFFKSFVELAEDFKVILLKGFLKVQRREAFIHKKISITFQPGRSIQKAKHESVLLA